MKTCKLFTQAKLAFSLVELSIVLVILGLLVGGVLSGQSLIRAAELRSISSDHSRFVAAVQTFRDKYFALPGDMANATAFWGVAHATPATCRTTASTSALTCNGDGNGLVNDNAGSMELYRFWQHLASAGLIEGTYSGINVGGVSIAAHTPGTNAPRAKLSNVGWSTSNDGLYAGDTGAFAFNYGNRFSVGAQIVNGWPHGRAFKPEEVWNIDTKLDDGRPGIGRLIAIYWDECTNATSQSNTTADYLLTNTNRDCAIYFPQSY